MSSNRHRSIERPRISTHHIPQSQQPISAYGTRNSKDFRFETAEMIDNTNYTLHHATELLRLNVGGVHYTTLYETVARVHSSFFGHYLKIDSRSGKVVRFNAHIIDDGSGAIFLNRDGKLFAYVLQYMRDGRQAVLPRDESLLRQIQREAQYYCLEGLRQLVADTLQDFHNDTHSNETLDNIYAQVKQISHSLAFTTFNNRS
ncbi:unnamed protein product, partial [Mesorhabditis spiculigera]